MVKNYKTYIVDWSYSLQVVAFFNCRAYIVVSIYLDFQILIYVFDWHSKRFL